MDARACRPSVSVNPRPPRPNGVTSAGKGVLDQRHPWAVEAALCGHATGLPDHSPRGLRASRGNPRLISPRGIVTHEVVPFSAGTSWTRPVLGVFLDDGAGGPVRFCARLWTSPAPAAILFPVPRHRALRRPYGAGPRRPRRRQHIDVTYGARFTPGFRATRTAGVSPHRRTALLPENRALRGRAHYGHAGRLQGLSVRRRAHPPSFGRVAPRRSARRAGPSRPDGPPDRSPSRC